MKLPYPIALSCIVDALELWLDAGHPAADALGVGLPPLMGAARDLFAEAVRRLQVRHAGSPLGLPDDALEQQIPFHRPESPTVQHALAALANADGLDPRPADLASLEPLPASDFVTVSRCGAWKDARIARLFDERFGEGEWRAGYTWGPHTLDVRSGIEIYEDGYYHALASRPELVDWIVSFAEVYDTAPSNVDAYCDYSVQEVEAAGQHWQDVAVRRCLLRLGRWFEGEELLEIRGKDSGGYRLNPGQLPFHRPDLLVEPRQYAWWEPDSIEDFSVSNFCIQVPATNLERWLGSRESLLDDDVLDTILHARHRVMVPILESLATASIDAEWLRPLVFIARTLSAGAASHHGWATDFSVPDLVLEHVAWLEGLGTEHRRIIDRLLSPEPFTRRGAFGDLEQLAPPDRTMALRILTEDPARKLRNLAKAELASN